MSIPESKVNIETDIESRSRKAWTYRYPVHNQNYVVMTIVDSGKLPVGLKVFGTFSTIEEANATAADISAENDFYDVLVAETNQFVPCPPTREFIEQVEYQEDKMNQIRDSFNQVKDKNAKKLKEALKKDIEDKEERARQLHGETTEDDVPALVED